MSRRKKNEAFPNMTVSDHIEKEKMGEHPCFYYRSWEQPITRQIKLSLAYVLLAAKIQVLLNFMLLLQSKKNYNEKFTKLI